MRAFLVFVNNSNSCLFFLLCICCLFFYDNIQYIQIGDTHFYLLPNEMGQESFLYHDGGEKGAFQMVQYLGVFTYKDAKD